MDAILSKCFEIYGAWAKGDLIPTGPDTPLLLQLFELLKANDSERAYNAFWSATHPEPKSPNDPPIPTP